MAFFRNSTTPCKVTYVSRTKGDEVYRDEAWKIANSFYFHPQTTGGAGKTCFLIWSLPSETKFSRKESPLPRFFSFKVVIAGVEYDRSWNPSNFDKGGRGVNFTQFKKHHSQPSKLQYPPSWLLCSGFKFTSFTWCFTWCFPVYRKNWLLYSAIRFCWWRIKQKKANPRTIQRNRIDPTTERATVAGWKNRFEMR